MVVLPDLCARAAPVAPLKEKIKLQILFDPQCVKYEFRAALKDAHVNQFQIGITSENTKCQN
jgi:hypothetical protein